MLKIIFRKHNTKKNTHRVCSNTWCLLIKTAIYSVAHMLIKFILYGVLMPRLPCLQLLILITNKNCCNYTDHRVFFRKENTRVSANLLLIMSGWTKTMGTFTLYIICKQKPYFTPVTKSVFAGLSLLRFQLLQKKILFLMFCPVLNTD